jgi:hypothetical protein
MKWVTLLVLFNTAAIMSAQVQSGYFDSSGQEYSLDGFNLLIVSGELTCVGCVNHVLELAGVENVNLKKTALLIEVPGLFPDQVNRYRLKWQSYDWFDRRVRILSYKGHAGTMFSLGKLNCKDSGFPHVCIRRNAEWDCRCCSELFPENGSDEALRNLLRK